MCKETSLASGADFAKLDRYLRENVSVTCFSRMMDTPGSLSSFVALAFLDAWGQCQPGLVSVCQCVYSKNDLSVDRA